jgi:hypothetical protein
MQELPPSSTIACVQLPGELRYVAQAKNLQGFLAQRRYRGVGPPRYQRQYGSLDAGSGYLQKEYAYYEGYWQPFLNPIAVREAGFEVAEVLAWVQAHPGQVFTHPTFAACCLRWEDNTPGIVVYPLEEVYEENPATTLFFTPHSCWLTGKTYFQVVSAVPDTDPTMRALQEHAHLALHGWELGAEGTWQGWYTTDWAAAEATLAELGFSAALAERSVVHYVSFLTAAGEAHRTYYQSMEGAKTHFVQLPSTPQLPTGDAPYPLATLGAVERLAGQQVWAGVETEKALDASFCALPHFWLRGLVHNQATRQKIIPRAELSLTETPLPGRTPTLNTLLSLTGKSRPSIAACLNQSEAQLYQWERNPTLMTIRELGQVATFLGYALEQLLELLQEEFEAVQADNTCDNKLASAALALAQ